MTMKILKYSALENRLLCIQIMCLAKIWKVYRIRAENRNSIGTIYIYDGVYNLRPLILLEAIDIRNHFY